ncbi:MAG: hypothetical protein WDZ48_05900 [Pirellulales bacterium]
MTRKLLGANEASVSSGLSVVQALLQSRNGGGPKSTFAAHAIAQMRDAALPAAEMQLKSPHDCVRKGAQELLDALRATPDPEKPTR